MENEEKYALLVREAYSDDYVLHTHWITLEDARRMRKSLYSWRGEDNIDVVIVEKVN